MLNKNFMLNRAALILLTICIAADCTIRVGVDNTYCRTQGSNLKCDFEFAKDNVVLDSLSEDGSGKKITIVSLYNANKVYITNPVCFDVHFYTVHVVHFSKDSVCQKKLINLKFTDSTVNQVPRQLNRLELVRSDVTKISTDLGLQRISFSNSKIGEFNSPWPVTGSYMMKIQDSTIDRFVAMNIEGRVVLYISNTTINTMNKDSLTVGKGSTANFISSTIVATEGNAVVVKSGGNVLVKEMDGRLPITAAPPGKEDEFNRLPPGVPQKTLTPPPVPEPDDITGEEPYLPDPREKLSCAETPQWAWLIPTILATIEGITIIVMCGKKSPSRRKPSTGPDMESPSNLYNYQGGAAPVPNSSLNYYTEGPHNNPAYIRRR